jgi:choline-sulfatase
MTLTRRELLAAAAASPALGVLGTAALNPADVEAAGTIGGKNIVLFITDQERSIQHFPKDWPKENLPGRQRLIKNGVQFENAFCCACMCSPSRASMLTGYFPAQHEVRYTLEEDMPADQYPQVPLTTKLKNIASVMTAAGYDVVYKGKWHLSKPQSGTATPEDVARYGFDRWDPPDAGANQDVSEEGGGGVDNDGRYMGSVGNEASGTEGVLQYLQTHARVDQPFCLVVSLVNPHDVLLYPKAFTTGGYDDSWLNGEVELPKTVGESLATKPRAQRVFRTLFGAGSGPLPTKDEKRNYINFYANLMKSSDAYLVQVLDAIDDAGLTDDTLIVRTSDHGELGMAHGGLRQKVFNVYEETMRIPLIFSNPVLYPEPRTSSALVSHVDLLPTLAGLVGAPKSALADWEGVDYSKQVLGTSKKSPQDYVVFTFDDTQCGQSHGPYVPPPGNIVSIRERRWKIAEYFDPSGRRSSQWELYDLEKDPEEVVNLAFPGYDRSAEQDRQYLRLRRKLRRVQATRLQPLVKAPFRVRDLVLDGDEVTSKVRVPGKGTVTQRITWEDHGRTVVAAVVRKRVSGAGSVSLEATLSAATESRRVKGPLELSVRTSYLDNVGGAESVTDPLLAGRLNPSFTG